jgi:hypothetical protein
MRPMHRDFDITAPTQTPATASHFKERVFLGAAVGLGLTAGICAPAFSQGGPRSDRYSDEVVYALVVVAPLDTQKIEIGSLPAPFDGIRLIDWSKNSTHKENFAINISLPTPGSQLYCHYGPPIREVDGGLFRRWLSHDDGMVGLPVKGVPFSEAGLQRMKELAERTREFTKGLTLQNLGEGLLRRLPPGVYAALRAALEAPGGCHNDFMPSRITLRSRR